MTSFAVVIPLYNKGPHIARTLDSVLAQTRPADEIVIVDDNSSDDGPAIVERYRERDPRIRTFRRTTPGPGGYAARNLGITEAKSEWIAFLDADDAWMPDHLATVAASIDEAQQASSAAPLVCVFSGYRIIEADGTGRPDRYSQARGRQDLVSFEFAALLALWLELGDCPIWTSAAALRRDSLIAAGSFPAERCRRGGDKDLWLRTAALGRTAAAPATTAIYYRDAVNMVTRTQSTNARHCMCETIVAMLRRGGGSLHRLLRRLFNQEVYNYSVYAIRSNNIDPAIWSGFYVRENPLKFATLLVLTVPGVPVLARLARGIARRGRGNPS